MTPIVPTLPIWKNTSQAEFDTHTWQDRNAIFRTAQLDAALSGVVQEKHLLDIKAGVELVNMSIRITPYVMEMIDWENVATDPIRKQFLPMKSELEPDHPRLVVDSLDERGTSPVEGLVHRYRDKVLFLATSVCPVYCQFCTRSYAVGADTATLQKDSVASAAKWTAMLDYIRSHTEIEDVVVSGGDSFRLKAASVRLIGNALLDIEHVRRVRFASKGLAVQPMKLLSDTEWFDAFAEIVERGRREFKHVCLHTHFNHPREVTPLVEAAMRKLHAIGATVRNQTVLLRGVNDQAPTLQLLIKKLSRVNIQPYYVYLCDMVKGSEHFRLPLHVAQRLEREVRGTTAGFNTPLFIVDTPTGKRDVHSAEAYDRDLGISAFSSPVVAPGRVNHYFDPLYSLPAAGRATWLVRQSPVNNDTIEQPRKVA